jgi:hypothetical protein
MPRPKPPLPLKHRYVRMSDAEWLMFKELGGAEWLRTYVKQKAKFPAAHYQTFKQEKI